MHDAEGGHVDVFEMVHSATVVDKADAAVCPQPNCGDHISTTYRELEISVNENVLFRIPPSPEHG